MDGRECKPGRAVFIKPGFTGLTASKPWYPGLMLIMTAFKPEDSK